MITSFHIFEGAQDAGFHRGGAALDWCETFCTYDNIELDGDGMTVHAKNLTVGVRTFNGHELPVKFGQIEGNFECDYKKMLKGMRGMPDAVSGDFKIGHCSIASLEGGPKIVGGSYDCSKNLLKSLRGCPDTIGGNFTGDRNPLENYANGPRVVNGWATYHVADSNVLYGLPQVFQRILFFGGDPAHVSTYIETMRSIPEGLRRTISRDHAYTMAIKISPTLEKFLYPDGMPKDINTDDVENLSNFL